MADAPVQERQIRTHGMVMIGLLFVQYAYLRGYFNFNWLKQTLLWLQKHFP